MMLRLIGILLFVHVVVSLWTTLCDLYVMLIILIIQAFHLQLRRVDTVTNVNYLRLDMRINNASRDNTVDGYVNLMKTLDGIVLITIAFYEEMTNGRMKKAYALPTQNYCNLLRYSNNIPFIRDFLQQISQYGTIPMSCPIRRGYYYVKNCTFTGMATLPPTIANGNYQVKFKLVDGNGKKPILALRLKAYLTIEMD
jgi:Protein of unknown function (DUF1091)